MGNRAKHVLRIDRATTELQTPYDRQTRRVLWPQRKRKTGKSREILESITAFKLDAGQPADIPQQYAQSDS